MPERTRVSHVLPLALAVFAALGAFTPKPADGQELYQGESADFGDGVVTTYVALDAAGHLTSIGVRMSASTFDELPTEPDGTAPCFDVNGDGTCALYQLLKEAKPGDIGWNFTKFLVDGAGNVVERFEPQVTPEDIEPRVKELLG